MFLENHLDTQILHFGKTFIYGLENIVSCLFSKKMADMRRFFKNIIPELTYAVCGNDNKIIEIFFFSKHSLSECLPRARVPFKRQLLSHEF